MSPASPVALRPATADDAARVCAFGARIIPAHYTPLIGPDAAARQVRDWWSAEHLERVAGAGRLLVAETPTHGVVGVAQWGDGADGPALYKLYLDPTHRGGGLGRRLLAAVTAALPADTRHLDVEHFAANTRAGEFYAREGFGVIRVAPDPDGDPRRAVVWRRRMLAAGEA
jgi:GNAT superfamily N-acetyltransferase